MPFIKRPAELYRFLAQYYDHIYGWKDYLGETTLLVKIIKQYRQSDGRALLDMACGTGGHLKYLVNQFDCTGVDLHSEMLDGAVRKVPSATYIRGDMTNVRCGRLFDVVTCLFSSIAYLKTYDRLVQAFKNFSAHLRPGGIAVIEPWLTQKAYSVGRPGMAVYDGEKIKIARLTIAKKKGMVSTIDMNYMVAEWNRPVRHFYDRHEMAMYNTRRMLTMMERVGLEAKFIAPHQPFDRGLLVGVKTEKS